MPASGLPTARPLYQLLVLATVLSARISAGIAVAAARELFAAGYRGPEGHDRGKLAGPGGRALLRCAFPE